MMLKRLLLAALLAISFACQAAVYSLPWGPKPQFVDANGAPMSGGSLLTFVGSSTTPQVTYTDSTGGVANPTTITLNTRGESPNEIWLTGGVTYKFVLKDSAGSTIWTVDNVAGVNDVTGALDEWIAAPAPTFVSATSFTLVGDQTTTFTKGTRVKTTNSGGTIYSTVVNSAFAVSTTVTVANDSGLLDSGLSAVSRGIIRATNPSISPDMVARKGTAVTSAATTDIWSIVGDFVHVTGTTTITSLGTAPYAGVQRTLIFDGALTLTHNATTLQLPGAANIFTAAGDRAIVRADTTANMIVVEYTRTSGTPAVGTSVPRSYLAGCTLSTAGSSATMTIAACQSTDSTNALIMSNTSSVAKTTSAWAVGAGGCLDTGAIANTTWYHFYQITRTDTGVVDYLCSTSALAPTMPSSYTLKRRIGSGLTNGSAQWVAFTQDGDLFQLVAPVLETTSANPGTAAVTQTLANVPTGVNVNAFLNVAGSGSFIVYLSDLSTNDAAPSSTVTPLATTGGPAIATFGAQAWVRTNTSAQIRSRISASGGGQQLFIVALGWRDTRGRDQ